MSRYRIAVACCLLTISSAVSVSAQERAYFVTYDHHLEEPGNLEISIANTGGLARADQRTYFAPYIELEYGTKTWWTSELYVEWQSTLGDSAIFTGWRFENRFRPLSREHWINPVLYLEYENINEASRIQKEIVGNAGEIGIPNSELRQTAAHELETKLILSSNTHNWNIAENFIIEKNLSEEEGFEFGYSVGVSRPLATLASASNCRFCRENFVAGVELYGGLGSSLGFGLHDTAHYIAPVISWQVSDNSSIHFSPSIGITHSSNPLLIRFSYTYEVRDFGSKVASLFGRR